MEHAPASSPAPPVTEPGSTRLFLYGTLRSGGAANHLLRGGRLLGERTLTGTLHDVRGRYPALRLGGARVVHGELWEIPSSLLPALDRYEGVDAGLYQRVQVEVEGARCWTYVAGPALEGALGPCNVLPGGRWPAV